MTTTTDNRNEFDQASMEQIRAAIEAQKAHTEAQREHSETMRTSRRLQAKQVSVIIVCAAANCIQALAVVAAALAIAYGAEVFR
jgi:ferric-dicitrate binding protein FerR (iron transport regulator)